jgi:hypothetical protein
MKMIKKSGLLTRLLLMLLGSVLLLVSVIDGSGYVMAQGEPSVIKSSAETQFPNQISFNLKANGSADITDIRLHYLVERDSFARIVSEIKPVFTQGMSVDTSWVMDMRQTGGLPSGAVVQYWWTIRDASGNSIISDMQKVTFDDARYKWHRKTEGNITLFWYDGDDEFAATLLDTAIEGLERLEADTGAVLTDPVKVYIYANSNDLQGAMIYPQDWTGGVAYTNYNTIAIGISKSNLEWGKVTIAHELAHLVTYQTTRNPYNGLPNWLSEGISMYAEGELDFTFKAVLTQALNDNTTITVRSLCSPFSAYADQSYLAYAESYSLVDYLISTYGQEKLSQLLRVFQQGSDYDAAFLAVYDFDMKGLNDFWLAFAVSQYLPQMNGVNA